MIFLVLVSAVMACNHTCKDFCKDTNCLKDCGCESPRTLAFKAYEKTYIVQSQENASEACNFEAFKSCQNYIDNGEQMYYCILISGCKSLITEKQENDLVNFDLSKTNCTLFCSDFCNDWGKNDSHCFGTCTQKFCLMTNLEEGSSSYYFFEIGFFCLLLVCFYISISKVLNNPKYFPKDSSQSFSYRILPS